jgi:hypothetical protein
MFLTDARGDAGPQKQVLLIKDAPSTTQGTTTFVAPGVNVLNVVNQQSQESWFTTTPWEKDMEITDAASAVLYFSANAQALTVFEVRLIDVHPDGAMEVLAKDSQQFVTAFDARPVSFLLNAQGRTLGQGDLLQVQVFVQTGNAAVLLHYGGASATGAKTPSGLVGFTLRWLDSDGDGISDSDERKDGSNPLNPSDFLQKLRDSDGDGLSDTMERTIGTDPSRVDTDGDGFGDGIEVYAGTNPLDPKSFPGDANHNGLPDAWEIKYFNNTTNIDPLADPDHDGCNNLCEAAHGTDPNNPDTDGDGIKDGDEIARGSDPLRSGPLAARPDRSELQSGGAMFALISILSLFGILRWKP